VTPPRILVTRQPEQAGALREGLAALGAIVVEVPLIAVVPPADAAPLAAAVAALRDYAWVAFTSANAVQAVARRQAAWPDGPRIASVGPATTAAIRAAWPAAAVTLEPETEHSAEGLLRALEAVAIEGRRVLLPQSERARDVLAAGLRARGAVVDAVTAYRNVPPADLGERLAAALVAGVDIVTFASPSAVEALAAAAPDAPGRVPSAVIGPVTEAAARRAGFEVAAVAVPSTAAGLIDALRGWLAARGRRLRG
jgi:uroporphyrinogen-III synthase